MIFDLKELKRSFNMNITGVIHVGAFDGQEANVYREMGILRAMFFEPQKHLYELTKLRAQGYETYSLGLGNYNGSAILNISHTNVGGISNGSGASSSILKPKTHLEQYPHITFPRTEEITIRRLDDFLYEKNKLKYNEFAHGQHSYECKYNFMNIDVQGYELEVLKGAEDTLNCIDYILCEVNRAELYEGCPMVEEIDKFLFQRGFNRVATNWAGETWGDALYVKIN